MLFTILLALAGSAGIPARAAFPVSAGTSIAASSAVSEEELIHNRMVMERLFHPDAPTATGEKTEPGYTLLLLGAVTVLVPCIILLAGRNKKRWSVTTQTTA
jgi:hypothetical protein